MVTEFSLDQSSNHCYCMEVGGRGQSWWPSGWHRLEQWFSTGGILPLRRRFSYCHHSGAGRRSGHLGTLSEMLLNILQRTGQPPHSKELAGQKCQKYRGWWKLVWRVSEALCAAQLWIQVPLSVLHVWVGREVPSSAVLCVCVSGKGLPLKIMKPCSPVPPALSQYPPTWRRSPDPQLTSQACRGRF